MAITASFDSPPRGVPILVETFAGKRHYYFCVSADADLASALQPVVERYPHEKLTWTFRTTGGWEFLDDYAKEFPNF